MADKSSQTFMSDDYDLLVGSATYPTRATLEAGRGSMVMRDVMEPGRYNGGALTDVGETVTIPEGTRFLMYYGAHQVVNVHVNSDIVETTNEASGATTLVARITQEAATGNLQFNVLAVAPGDVDANDITLGLTAAGVFTEDAGLDATGRFQP